MRWVRAVTVTAVALLALAGASAWADAGPAGTRPTLAPAPRPLPVLPRLTVVRAGGLSGVRQALILYPDGLWLFLPDRGSALHGAPDVGRLSLAQRARLAGLVASLSSPGPDEPPCPGGYRYELTGGPVSTVWTDCEGDDRPGLAAFVALLRQATPL